MRLPIISRTLHKWLTLVFCVQLMLWALSGFYMVVVGQDFIHGDALVRNLRMPLAGTPAVTFSEVARGRSQITQMALRSLPGLPSAVYEITTNARKVLIDATSGRQLSPLPESAIRALALLYYAGDGQLVSLSLIERDPPVELRPNAPPLWRADFNDWLATSLYLQPDTGVLVTRRHRFWRWYDFLWMLHIMDFEAREDANNGLLRAASVLGIATVLSGLWLTYFSFLRKLSLRP